MSIPPRYFPKYPWHELEVGQSFYVEGRPHKYWTSLVAARKRRDPTRNYTVRKDGKGFRIWRLKDRVPAVE